MKCNQCDNVVVDGLKVCFACYKEENKFKYMNDCRFCKDWDTGIGICKVKDPDKLLDKPDSCKGRIRYEKWLETVCETSNKGREK